MKKYLDLIVVTVVLTFGVAMLTYVDASGDRKPTKSQDRSQDRVRDAAGQAEQATQEKAVQKAKETSEHLGGK